MESNSNIQTGCLPKFENLEQYSKQFFLKSVWSQSIPKILQQLNIKFDQGEKYDIIQTTSGSFPAFIIQPHNLVIKFFSQIFESLDGNEEQNCEIELYNFLNSLQPPLPIPQLKYQGFALDLIEKGNYNSKKNEENINQQEWRWPFIIITLMKGQSIHDLLNQHITINFDQMAIKLGQIIRQMHDQSKKIKENQYQEKENWPKMLKLGFFQEFMTKQIQSLEERLTKWGFPDYLVKESRQYILNFQKEIENGKMLDQSQLTLVHGDLHWDHIFLEDASNACNLSGFIDLGDSMLAHPCYELLSLHFSSFLVNKQYLVKFLDSYGWIITDTQQFKYQLMCFSLCHQFNIFDCEENKDAEILLSQYKNLDELSSYIWDISNVK